MSTMESSGSEEWGRSCCLVEHGAQHAGNTKMSTAKAAVLGGAGRDDPRAVGFSTHVFPGLSRGG